MLAFPVLSDEDRSCANEWQQTGFKKTRMQSVEVMLRKRGNTFLGTGSPDMRNRKLVIHATVN